MTKLLTLGILFSTTLRAVLIVKLVILGIALLASFILALGVALVAKLAWYTSFLTTSFFYYIA